MEPHIHYHPTTSKLADGKTRMKVDKWLKLPVNIERGDEIATGTVTFGILDTCSQEAIIGLPGIFFSGFLDIFINLLRDAEAEIKKLPSGLKQPEDQPCNVLLPEDMPTEKHPYFDPPKHQKDIILPWSQPPVEDAPEDNEESNPLPRLYPINYAEKKDDELLEDFYNLLETNVCLEFAKSHPIIPLLKAKGRKVFVHDNWDGIHHAVEQIPDIEFEFLPSTPLAMDCKQRPVNPNLLGNSDKELIRMRKYQLMRSFSSVCSPLVIADKKTPPYIRICGDYTRINKYIVRPNRPIPNVPYMLGKIKKYKYFADIDWANAFHQLRLAERTRRMLALKTHQGLFEPIFMPEGVPPASGILQELAERIFGGQDWTIVAFDNILVMAETYDQLLRRIEWVLDRAIEYNVKLKFSKTFIGFDHCHFFGYMCRHGYHELCAKYLSEFDKWPFPSDQKAMQRFLGSANFCHRFIPGYADYTIVLNKMTHKNFNWKDRSTWPANCYEEFERFKVALKNAAKLYYPDYELDWVMQVDASQYAVGVVLWQLLPLADGTFAWLPIGFGSQTLSPQACNWPTIEQECYSFIFGFKYFEYYIKCKTITLETDHRNLLWMETSESPKIIRWKIYMQRFTFFLRHIPGKSNVVADYLSRVNKPDFLALKDAEADAAADAAHYDEDAVFEMPPEEDDQLMMLIYERFSPYNCPTEESSAELLNLSVPVLDEEGKEVIPDAHTILRMVHCGRSLHPGIVTTLQRCDKFYPGHGITYEMAKDFCMACSICQKTRLAMTRDIKPQIRNIRPFEKYAQLGCDFFTISPKDKNGYCGIYVCCNHHSKHAMGYLSKDHSALSAASAIFQYFCTYGIFHSLWTDPGSDFTSEVIRHLNRWLGVHHVISVVDRHESNGVEGTNKKVLRYLSVVAQEERVTEHWSEPWLLPLIFYFINSEINSETGLSPLVHTFGTEAARNFLVGSNLDLPVNANPFIAKLDSVFKVLEEITTKHQRKIIAKREAPNTREIRGHYVHNDLILLQENPDKPLPTKLHPKYRGPYRVLSQKSNVVQCEHCNLKTIHDLHVSTVKRFWGTLAEAEEAAKLDRNQHTVKGVLSYTGNPKTRSYMTFEVLFGDDKVVRKNWDEDLYQCEPFFKYLESDPALRQLLKRASESEQIYRKESVICIDDPEQGNLSVDVDST